MERAVFAEALTFCHSGVTFCTKPASRRAERPPAVLHPPACPVHANVLCPPNTCPHTPLIVGLHKQQHAAVPTPLPPCCFKGGVRDRRGGAPRCQAASAGGPEGGGGAGVRGQDRQGQGGGGAGCVFVHAPGSNCFDYWV